MTKQEEFLDILKDPTKVVVDKKRDEFLETAKTLDYKEDKPEVYLEEHTTYSIIHAKAVCWQSLATLDILFTNIFKGHEKYTRFFSDSDTASNYSRRYYICTNYFDEQIFRNLPIDLKSPGRP